MLWENTSAWGTLPSVGRCDGAALGWKPPGQRLGAGSWAPGLSPPGSDALKGKASHGPRLPGAPNPGERWVRQLSALSRLGGA